MEGDFSVALEHEAGACSGLKDGHKEYTGTLSDLGLRSRQGCQACSIVYNGLITFGGAWSSPWLEILPEQCNVSWKIKDSSTLAVLVRHHPAITSKHKFSVFIEFLHNQGPFKTLELFPSIRFGCIVPENPQDSFDTMLEWIKNCQRSHPNCQGASKSTLPRRVIDVGSEQRPRLYESSGERAPYVALSHRWGNNQLLKTTLSTLKSRKKLINWSELSRTFQDSILFTAKLGIRYIWIDSLCIIQDSQSDWQEESSKMASTYENAFVTIAANNTEDATVGLYAPRRAKMTTIKINTSQGPPISVLVRQALKHNQFYDASAKIPRDNSYPLFERAWCFQERILATRILHFTRNEVIFECKTRCHCECTSIGLNQETFIKAYYRDLFAGKYYVNSWQGWKTVVSDYAKKQLTDRRDVLPALAGLASRLQSEDLGRYLGGLWEKELANGLFWYTTDSKKVDEHIYTAPSFTWASLIGRVDFKDVLWTKYSTGSREDTYIYPNFTIVNVNCSVNGRNAYGEVSSGFVNLEVTCHKAELRFSLSQNKVEMVVLLQPKSDWKHLYNVGSYKQKVQVYLDNGSEQYKSIHNMRFMCFVGYWKSEGVGLLLEFVSDGTYRRIGYFEGLRRYPGQHFRTFESHFGIPRRISIV